jgi:hypothetical protein
VGSGNLPEAQQVAEPKSVGFDNSSYPRPLRLIEYLNPKMLGLEASQTHVHLD